MGLKGMIGRPLLKIFNDIYASKQNEIVSIAKEYNFDLGDVGQRARAIEEWLAQQAEKFPKDSFVDRVVVAVRRFLKRIGLKIEFSDSEIRQLLIKAREHVIHGKQKTKLFKQTASVGDQAEFSLDTEEGLGKESGFSQFINSAPSPNAMSEYEKAKDEWFGEKDWQQQKNSVETGKFQDRIKSALGKKRYDQEAQKFDQAIHIYIDLKRHSKDIDSYVQKLNSEQLEILRLAEQIQDNDALAADQQDQKLTELRKIADGISEQYDDTGLLSLSEGLIFNVLDNYVSRSWKPRKGQRGLPADTGALFKTTTRHAKQRVFETILEGWSTLDMSCRLRGLQTLLSFLKTKLRG